VIDPKPRELASGYAEMLRALARRSAITQMELRLYAEKVAQLGTCSSTSSETPCVKRTTALAQSDNNSVTF